MFITAVNPMYSNQDLEEVQYDLDKPRIRCAKFWRVHRNTVYWCNLKQVVYMKTGKDVYCKVHPFPRLPRVVLTPNSKCGRQNPPNPEARKSTDHHSEQSASYRETCRGNVDSRISRCTSVDRRERRLESLGNRQKADSTVREAPEQGLVNTGFKRESGIQSVQRKVEGVITSMGNTRAVRDFFQDTMSRSFFTVGYWHRILHGKCLQPAERNRQFEQD